VTLESAGKRKDHAFLIKNVDAKVDALSFKIRESKHDFAYKVFAPLASGLIKKAIGLAVEQAIKTGLGYVDEQLVEVRDRLDEAKDSDSESMDLSPLLHSTSKPSTLQTSKQMSMEEALGVASLSLFPFHALTFLPSSLQPPLEPRLSRTCSRRRRRPRRPTRPRSRRRRRSEDLSSL